MKVRWALNLSNIKIKTAGLISKHGSMQIKVGQVDIFTPLKVSNKSLISSIKHTTRRTT